MAKPTRRVQRLNLPHIDIPLRSVDGKVTFENLWREDHLVYGLSRYKVLDFGLEETLVTIGTLNEDEHGVPFTTQRNEWRASGSVTIQVQQIDDDGNGLAEPTLRNLDPPDELGVTSGWLGWAIDPRSPRRPSNWPPPSSPPSAPPAPSCAT